MQKIIILLGLLIAGAVFILTSQPASASLSSIFYKSACESPIEYKIGNIDPQFKVSASEFKTDIAKGTDIWEKSYPKNLFDYNPDAKLKINLTYDARQQNFDKTKNISNQVKKIGGEVDKLGDLLSQNKNNLEPEIKAYQQRVQAFNQRVQKLNSDIEYWNNRGGAPPDEFDRLNKEREAIRTESEALNKKAEELNKQKQNYNSEVNKYNSQLSDLNQKTGQLNESIGNLKAVIENKPEEGLYDPNSGTIDIYFNIDEDELIQTLAHELGHARGLEHNNNPKSIMYKFTNKQSTPSAEDLADLNEICRVKSLPEISFEKFQVVLIYYSQLIQNSIPRT